MARLQIILIITIYDSKYEKIFSSCVNYKDLHPIRFSAIIVGGLIIVLIICFILYKIRKKPKKKTSKGVKRKKPKFFIRLLVGQFLIIILLFAFIFFYKTSIKNKVIIENTSITTSNYIFGIDISHYQDKIDWKKVRTSKHPIEFVFIRATMGERGSDRYFKRNWESAKKHNFIRGAYHYYRPNESSTEQFENFKYTVRLEKGDFFPVLDIEQESRHGRKKLREGVLNWLKLAEKEYKVKPIIYTGLSFYNDILKGYVDEYPLWIAAYSGKHRLLNINWTFHQFTEKVRIKGINSTVDGNDFRGNLTDLNKLRIIGDD